MRRGAGERFAGLPAWVFALPSRGPQSAPGGYGVGGPLVRRRRRWTPFNSAAADVCRGCGQGGGRFVYELAVGEADAVGVRVVALGVRPSQQQGGIAQRDAPAVGQRAGKRRGGAPLSGRRVEHPGSGDPAFRAALERRDREVRAAGDDQLVVDDEYERPGDAERPRGRSGRFDQAKTSAFAGGGGEQQGGAGCEQERERRRAADAAPRNRKRQSSTMITESMFARPAAAPYAPSPKL